MASLRFSRDKRGYEHFYLVHTTPTRRGKPRTRVLYWFRTPPNVKVGREPFDEELRRRLEAQHPEVDFDWKKILDTPIPPPGEPERWRERRQLERAAKQAARAEAAEEAAALAEAQGAAEPRAAIDRAPEEIEAAAGEVTQVADVPGEIGPAAADGQAAPAAGQQPESHARRRRRRRRRGHRPAGPDTPAPSGPGEASKPEV